MDEMNHNSEHILRVYVNSDDGRQRSRLIKVVKTYSSKGVDIHLPKKDELVSLGWIPEMIYKLGNSHHSLDITISPKLDTHHFELDRICDKATCTSVNVCPEEPDSTTSSNQNNTPIGREPEKPNRVYEVTFRNRKVRINGLVLSEPRYDSENEIVFNYIFSNPNRKISLNEIESKTGISIAKRIGVIVRDLGFKKDLKKMFFPDVSKTALRFVNPVTSLELRSRGIQLPRIFSA